MINSRGRVEGLYVAALGLAFLTDVRLLGGRRRAPNRRDAYRPEG